MVLTDRPLQLQMHLSVEIFAIISRHSLLQVKWRGTLSDETFCASSRARSVALGRGDPKNPRIVVLVSVIHHQSSISATPSRLGQAITASAGPLHAVMPFVNRGPLALICCSEPKHGRLAVMFAWPNLATAKARDECVSFGPDRESVL
jgi:hypothetical protein